MAITEQCEINHTGERNLIVYVVCIIVMEPFKSTLHWGTTNNFFFLIQSKTYKNNFQYDFLIFFQLFQKSFFC